MKKIGILYDNISGNLGDIAIGLSVKKILRSMKVEFDELIPGRFNPSDYSNIIVGGGHLLRPSPDFFYDKFKISGAHILNACGIVGMPEDLGYLDGYKYVSVRSKGDKEKLQYLKKEAKIVPCTSMLLDKSKEFKFKIKKPSLGIHIYPKFLKKKEEKEFIKWASNLDFKVYFLPITHYNYDFIYLRDISSKIRGSKILPILKVDEVFTAINNFDCFISSSLHGAIFSYINNVPFIVLDWEKMRFFMKDRGLDRHLYSNFKEMKRSFENLMDKSPDYSMKVNADLKILDKHIQVIQGILEAPKMKSVTGLKAQTKDDVVQQLDFQIHYLQLQTLNYDARIRKLEKKLIEERANFEKRMKTNLIKQFKEPMGKLLALYERRSDLQSTFPEVERGNYSRLLKWARDVLAKGEDSASKEVVNYTKWYKKNKWPELAEDLKRTKKEHSELKLNIMKAKKECSELKLNIRHLEEEKSRITKELKKATKKFVELKSTFNSLELEKGRLVDELKKTSLVLAQTNDELRVIKESFGYNLMRFYSRIDKLFPEGTRRGRLWKSIINFFQIIIREGPLSTFKKIHVRKVEKIPKAAYGDKYYSLDIDSQYQIWLENNKFTDGLLKKLEESSKKFHYKPKISIVMPVYNTDSRWLSMAIESVINQTYSNWELCISDDASTKKSVKNVLNKYRKKDPRINTVYLHKNSGIASASNAAISLTTGEFIGFLDHDDELMPDTLIEVVKLLNKKPQTDFIYTDEDKKDQKGRRVEPFFKPDWSPDLLLSMNYPGHFCVFRKSLIKDVGGFRLGFEGSQDYDLILRFTEKTNKIAHISKPLYSWRKIPGSAATKIDAKPFARKSAIKALQDTLERRGIEGEVDDGYSKGYYRVKYKIKDDPLVSIIILTKDKYKVFKKCIESIESVTAYKNYEIIILDHNSRNPDAVKYLNSLKSKYRIVKYHGEFNFAKMNNLCVSKAKGMHIVFLNNDIEIIEPQWLEAMLEHSQRPEVGIVGTLLLYPEKKFMGEKIQHGGVVLGVGGFANHAFRNISKKSPGYFMLPKVVRNCSAVTAACAMIRRNVFEEMGGFDECLAVAFNDVDLCLSLKDKGYRIVYTPFSVLLHHEHKTRDAKHPPEDETYALKRWGEVISKGDPYYNLNLSSILCFRIAPKSFMDRPISALFEIYYSRPDLQNMYPEVKLGNYENLIDWAVVNGVTIDGARHLIRPYYSWYVENASQKVKPLGTLFDLYNLDTKLQKLFPEVLNGKYDRIIKWASQINQKDCKKNPELKKLLPYLPWYENNKSKIPLII